MKPSPEAIREVLLDLLESRGPQKSFCPSEAARRLYPDDWRRWMPDVRAAAERLEAEGSLIATQGGVRIEPAQWRGPLRFRKPCLTAGTAPRESP